jgi:hypothetical protein
MKPGYYIAFILILLFGFVWIGPYYTVYQLKEGVESNDAEKIAAHVDFTQLRQNLKAQLNAQAVNAVAGQNKNNPATNVAAGLTGIFAGAIVDQMVTPAGLATIMRGEKVNPLKKNTHVTTKPFTTAHFRFDSKTTFSAYIPDKKGKEIRFVLTRDWFVWKLTNIILPVD